jgi:hypothetical protein
MAAMAGQINGSAMRGKKATLTVFVVWRIL